MLRQNRQAVHIIDPQRKIRVEIMAPGEGIIRSLVQATKLIWEIYHWFQLIFERGYNEYAAHDVL